jgi:MFS family permease
MSGVKTQPEAGPAAQVPSVGRWIVLCAAAEGLGMAATAGAAKTSQWLVGEPSSGPEVAVVLLLVVAGGLVEGTALGVFQAAGLRRWLPRLNGRRWVLVTMAVAGVGWAGASAPAVLAGGGGSGPPWIVVYGGAAVLGGVMGAVLGAAQALLLRGRVRTPRRWVDANALAWAPAMMVIFLGATTPAADWPALAVTGLGAVTGLTGGAVLGLVTGWFLPSLSGPPPHNRIVLAVLASPAHAVFGQSLVGLRVRGAVTGRQFELPVMYAATTSGLIVVPGKPQAKRWWRNLRHPSPLDVLYTRQWRPATGAVLQPGDADYDAALAAYRHRWPRAPVPHGSPVVQITLGHQQH